MFNLYDIWILSNNDSKVFQDEIHVSDKQDVMILSK